MLDCKFQIGLHGLIIGCFIAIGGYTHSPAYEQQQIENARSLALKTVERHKGHPLEVVGHSNGFIHLRDQQPAGEKTVFDDVWLLNPKYPVGRPQEHEYVKISFQEQGSENFASYLVVAPIAPSK